MNFKTILVSCIVLSALSSSMLFSAEREEDAREQAKKELIEAAKQGEPLIVQQILDKYPDMINIRKQNQFGHAYSLMSLATRQSRLGNLQVILLLAKRGADVNDDTCPLMEAVSNQNNYYPGILMQTVDFAQMIRLLILLGADPHKKCTEYWLDVYPKVTTPFEAAYQQTKKLLEQYTAELLALRQTKAKRKAKEAFLAGRHPRAGAGSHVADLPTEVIQQILGDVKTEDFATEK